MNLTTEQQLELEDVIKNAYNLDSLKRMLRLYMGFRLDEELNTATGFRYVVSELVDLANRDGWIDKLILKGVEGAPANTGIKAFASQLNLTQLRHETPETVPAKDVNDLLEKAVRKRSPLMPFAGFQEKLKAIGNHICRIEYPEGDAQGTGWLVGPNLVLTAYHVIEDIDKNKNGLDSDQVICRFDYLHQDSAGQKCRLDREWLVAKSPYSSADLKETQDLPAPDELDFALLRLNESIGDVRGYIHIPEHPPVMSVDDFVIIPQHPDGRSQELAFGQVIEYNKNATRIRYDANTDHGSSGSPCFTINLTPFALHHASGPIENLAYNQAVPIREIFKLIKKNNFNSI